MGCILKMSELSGEFPNKDLFKNKQKENVGLGQSNFLSG